MKLYKEASLMMLPTSVKDGKLYSIFPQPRVIGEELVTNGDFDTDSDWTKQTAWSINNGVANYDGSANGSLLRQFNVLTIGKLYKLNFDILNNSGYYRIGGSFSNNVYTTYSYGNGSNTIYFEATATDVSIGGSMASGGDTFSIDNISVVEVDQAPADFDFSRGADRATRVTEQGLVRPVEIVGSELVNNGSFDTTLSSELVQNGDFEQIGSELVTNGDFDTDSDWTLGNGASISNGSLSYDGTQSSNSNTNQTITSLDLNKIYKVSFTVSNYVSGNVRVKISNDAQGVDRSADGEYIEYLSGMINKTLSVTGNADFVGSVDNISVKEVGQNWTFSGGAEFTEQGARINNTVTGANANIVQNNTNFTQGKLILFEYDVVATNGRKCIIERIGDDIELDTLTTGTNKKVYFVFDRADKNLLIKRGQSNTDVTLDNISVKEVQGLDDWILGDTAIYEGDGVRISSDGTVGSFLQQRNIVNSSSTYKLTFDVTEVQQSGSIRIGFSGSGVAQQTITQVGEYILYFQPIGTHLEIVRNSSIDVVLDNISLVEVTEATDLPRLDWSGECPVLLLEPQRTNIVPTSEGTPQSSTNVILTENYGTSPEGVTNSLKVQKNGTSANDRIFPISNNNATLVSGNDYTISCFVKNIDLRDTAVTTVGCRISGSTLFRSGFEWDGQSFSYLATGFNSGSRSNIFAKDYGNGWFRIGFTFQADGTSGNFELDVDRRFGSDTTSIETWGWQLEEGSYATSYIPTRGQAATRAADVCNNAGDSTIFNDEEGVLFAEIAALADDGTSRTISINNTSSNRVFLQLRATAGQVNSGVVVGGALQGSTMSHGVSQTSNIKLAIKYKQNDFSLFVNGSKVGTSSGNVFSIGTLNTLSFDNGSGSENFYGKCKSILYFNKTLSDNECINLTTI